LQEQGILVDDHRCNRTGHQPRQLGNVAEILEVFTKRVPQLRIVEAEFF